MPNDVLIATDETKRAAHVAYLESIFPAMIGRLAWSRAEIEDYQLSALRSQLRHAKRHSPWHAARLAQVDPDSFTLEDLALIPVIDKSALMENWDRIVTVPGATLAAAEAALQSFQDQGYIWGDHVLLASGGTGGRPGIFLYDWNAMAEDFAGMARTVVVAAVRRFGGRQTMRTATIGAESSAHGSYTLARTFSDPNNPALMLSAWRPIEEVAPALNDFQPDSLSCYPTYMPALADAARSGRLKIAPKVVFFGSEHLSPTNLEAARRTWPDADIFTCWATSEGGGTFPCPLGDGFHVSEDLMIIEPVDAAGATVGPGEPSHGIYITNLINKALPILRYYIDDIFEMDDKPCACGLAYRKVRQVHGRAFDLFSYGDTTLHPLKIELAILEQPSILEYQIRQTERGTHILFRSEADVDLPRLAGRVREAFDSYGLADAEVRLERVDAIARTGAGKLKRFVPLT